MESIRNWALTVALSALAGGIVWLLAPKGSVQKAVRTVVAVFLLCAFLSPLFGGQRGITLDWLLPEEADATLPDFNAAVSRQIQAAVEEELIKRISAVLEERKIAGQILLQTDILPEGSINIVTAKVALPQGTNTAGLREALKEATELDVQLS